MIDDLPREVREGLEAARLNEERRRGGLTVRAGGRELAVLRRWKTGFAVGADEGAGLRGLVDLYDRGRHLGQCLVVACGTEGDEASFEFKRGPALSTTPPRDFAPEPAEALALPPA